MSMTQILRHDTVDIINYTKTLNRIHVTYIYIYNHYNKTEMFVCLCVCECVFVSGFEHVVLINGKWWSNDFFAKILVSVLARLETKVKLFLI